MFKKSEITGKYFEDKNFKRLMFRIYDHFEKTYNYKVGTDEEELCHIIMKQIYSHNEPGKNEKRVDFIKRLNRLCVQELIRIITSKLNEINNTGDLVRNGLEGDLGNMVQSNAAQFQRPQMDISKKQEYTSDINQNFEFLSKQREQELSGPQLPPEPQFQLEMEKSNEDIMKAFEETQKQFELEKKEFEKSKKIITDNNGNDIVIKDEEEDLVPMAANDQNDDDKLIENDNQIIKSNDLKKNDLIIPQPKQYTQVMKNLYDTTTKDYFIVIDSRDRNHDLFPNSNNYQIEFDNVLRSVISVELVSAELPIVQYNINSNNNILHFTEGGDTLQAIIPIGQYDNIDDLRSTIQTAMNTADGASNDYTVSVSTITRKFTIQKGSGSFDLLFDGGTETFGPNSRTRTKYLQNSIGSVIGFSRTDQEDSLTYTSDNQYNLTGDNYVLLYIKELENLESVSGNSVIHDMFTKINLDGTSNNIKFYKQLDEYISRVSFIPPLASLGQMIIKFYNYDGSFYDFGGREHSLMFKITTLNQPTEYFQG